MSDEGRYTLRPSPELQAVVAAAQGGGERANALRALLYLGAATARLDLTPAQREIARLALEELNPRVVAALQQLPQMWQPDGSQMAAVPSITVDEPSATDVETDPFALGFDV